MWWYWIFLILDAIYLGELLDWYQAHNIVEQPESYLMVVESWESVQVNQNVPLLAQGTFSSACEWHAPNFTAELMDVSRLWDLNEKKLEELLYLLVFGVLEVNDDIDMLHSNRFNVILIQLQNMLQMWFKTSRYKIKLRCTCSRIFNFIFIYIELWAKISLSKHKSQNYATVQMVRWFSSASAFQAQCTSSNPTCDNFDSFF